MGATRAQAEPRLSFGRMLAPAPPTSRPWTKTLANPRLSRQRPGAEKVPRSREVFARPHLGSPWDPRGERRRVTRYRCREFANDACPCQRGTAESAASWDWRIDISSYRTADIPGIHSPP